MNSFTGPVCDYSVGFLRFMREGKIEAAEPAGTGTFVKIGRVYEILTAGHVLEGLDPKTTVGLVRFPSVQPPLQNRRIDLQHTERLVEWNGKDCDAPDIAFLKIPELDGRDLEAVGAVFYNLGILREFKLSNPANRMSICHAVVGVVGEWTERTPAEFMKGLKVVIGGLFGAAKIVREFKEGDTDLIEIELDYAHSTRLPKSHGGVSGGALWELHVELDAHLKTVKVSKRLKGVAFRQSGDHKRITSNSTPQIDTIIAKIQQKWPAAANA